MVDLFGQGNAARGYQLGVGVLCAIAVVMFLCCFFWVRERVPLSTMGKFTLREHLAGLRNNDQLLLMLVMSFLLINVFNIRGGGYMYFITYVLQGSTGYTSLFFTMVTFASIIGSVIVSPLTRRFDTVKIYYYTNLLLAALAVLMWFLPSGPAYQTLWLAVILGNGVILGFTLPLHFSLMAFADDYGEWKTRVRSSGMNFAFNLFFIKLASGLQRRDHQPAVYFCRLPAWRGKPDRQFAWRDHGDGNIAACAIPPAAGRGDPLLQTQ